MFYFLDPVLKVNRKYIPGALILRIALLVNLNRCTYLHLIRSPDGSFKRERDKEREERERKGDREIVHITLRIIK